MAKTFDSFIKNRNEQKMEKYLGDLEFLNAYASIYEQKLKNKKENQLKKLENKHQKMLYALELETLSNEDYVQLMSAPKIEKLNKKQYWAKRALITKYARQGVTLTESDQHTKIEAIHQEYQQRIDQVIHRFQKRNYSKETLESNIKTYERKKREFDEEKKVFIIKLDEKNKAKLQHLHLKIEDKSQTIRKNLASLESKLAKAQQEDTSQIDFEISEDAILKVDRLTMNFGGLKAVDELSFEVKKGEIFGLIGPNGAGKTTVFNCITQFYKSTQGNIYYRHQNNDIIKLDDIKVHNIIKLGIVRTFQNVELIWELSILDNMLVGAHTAYRTGLFSHSFQTLRYKREASVMRAKAEKILMDLDLILYKDFYPIGLPYGLLKKIELARTLMSNPKLIILDEPAAGLNDAETEALSETIKKIQKDYDCTIFLVEHDMGLVMNICDTVCAISFGKKLAIGTPNQIQDNKLVQEAYLGGE